MGSWIKPEGCVNFIEWYLAHDDVWRSDYEIEEKGVTFFVFAELFEQGGWFVSGRIAQNSDEGNFEATCCRRGFSLNTNAGMLSCDKAAKEVIDRLRECVK